MFCLRECPDAIQNDRYGIFVEDALASDNETAHTGAMQLFEEHDGKAISPAEITTIRLGSFTRDGR